MEEFIVMVWNSSTGGEDWKRIAYEMNAMQSYCRIVIMDNYVADDFLFLCNIAIERMRD